MKKKTKLIIYAAEIAFVAAMVVMLLLPKKTYEFPAGECSLLRGVLDGTGAAHIDDTIGFSGILMTTPYMNLGWGTYEATLSYSADGDGNMFYVTLPKLLNAEEGINDRFDTDVAQLKKNRTSATVEFFVRTRQSDYMMAVFYMGQGGVTVESVQVRQTNGGILRLLVIFAAVAVCVNSCIWMYGRKKEGKMQPDRIRTGMLLIGIILFSGIPLFLNYLLEGHDLSFHLLRIEGLKDGLLMGDFPVRIQPNWLDGNGYAASVFYGDLFLYIPALFRLCGFTVTEAYNIYVFIVNAATCLISYYCFKGMTGSSNAAAAGSAMYTLSLYRIINIYVRSAVGEYSAMVFLPLIAYGMWKIFSEPVGSEQYKNNWIIPVLGFTGILNTHILTCEMTGAFIILLCLIFVKKVFRRQTFWVLAKVVIFTCVFNAGFLVPFLDYMLRGGFSVTAGERFTSGIQQYGAFWGQLFVPFPGYSGLAVSASEGMAGEFPSAAGLALLVGAAAGIYALIMGYIKEKEKRVCTWVCIALGMLALLFSTHLFPWDIFQNMNRLFEKLISMISMPWRFLTVSSLMFTVAAVIAMAAMERQDSESAGKTEGARRQGNSFRYLAAVLAAVSAIQSGAVMSGVMNGKEPLSVHYGYALDNTDLIGCEYLPVQGAREGYLEQYAYADEGLVFEETFRKNTHSEFAVSNPGNETKEVNLSMVWYAGYTARDMETGERLALVPSENYSLSVRIEPGYQGTVRVSFEGFWYWKCAAWMSAASFILLALYYASRGRIKITMLKGLITNKRR